MTAGRRPGPAHERLAAFVGEWRTEGIVLGTGAGSAAGVPFTARDTYEWVPGGFFLLHRWDAQMPDGRTQGIEIIGYDEPRDAYVLRSYDSHGGTAEMEAHVADGVWTYRGDGVRFTGRFERDGGVFAGRWELRSDARAPWAPWMDVRLTKVE